MQEHYDCIIIGSGIAGLYISLLARELGSILVLTKGSIDDCNTRHAQGGIAAAIGKDDSPELHYRDTMAAGAGLSDQEAVRILVDEAADRIADLIRFGVPFDTLDGEIALTKEAAHSVPRILHAGGDATGEHIETTLSTRVRLSRVKVLENCLATSIEVEKGAVTGVKAFDWRSGTLMEFSCHFLILATGGAGRLFKYTTNSEVATGDGVALAFHAGARIKDMEFFQFHPTALRLPGVPPFLISEAVRGEGGILRNVEGHPFMKDYTPERELAPRDIVARSIFYEMKKTGSDRVFLDVTHLSPRLVTARFPQIYGFCLGHGLDITRGLIPVAPAAHYIMGGVETNAYGETSISRLFAAGEVACTGVHGANRLASNSLLEVLVFSKRIIEEAGRYMKGLPSQGTKAPPTNRDCHILPERSFSKKVPRLSISSLQSLLWEKVGIVRSGEELLEAAQVLASWQKTREPPTDRPSYDLGYLLLTARLVTEAALLREESRGAHFRTDFPHTRPEFEHHITFVSGKDKAQIATDF